MEFGFYDIIFVLGALIAMAGYQNCSRRGMLLTSVAVFICYIIYSYGAGAAGLVTMCIALAGLSFQIVIPERYLEKTLAIRNMAALLCVVAATGFIYNTPADIYPLIGFAMARLGEVEKCSQRIRMAYIGSYICWILYAIELGLISLFVCQYLIVISLLIATWNHERGLRKLALAPELVKSPA